MKPYNLLYLMCSCQSLMITLEKEFFDDNLLPPDTGYHQGKVIDRRDANPCKEGNARGKKMQVGKPWVRILQPAKDFFLQNSIKANFYDHLVVDQCIT